MQLSIRPFGRLTEATRRESVFLDILTKRHWIWAKAVLHANARDMARSLRERFFPFSTLNRRLNDSLDSQPSVSFRHLQAQDHFSLIKEMVEWGPSPSIPKVKKPLGLLLWRL